MERERPDRNLRRHHTNNSATEEDSSTIEDSSKLEGSDLSKNGFLVIGNRPFSPSDNRPS